MKRIAVVGATGAVGETILAILAQRGIPAKQVTALASEASAGSSVEYGNTHLTVRNLAEFDFSQADYGLFSAGGSVSAQYAPIAAAAGCLVIDNTSHFRYQDEVPLVVPEVNGDILREPIPQGIIANPNCSTIQMLLALAPIHRAVGVERITVATYQSVSGAGRKGMDELARQTAAKLSFADVKTDAFAQPIAFNVLPQIDSMQDNGYSREEMKMVWETQKILAAPELRLSATCVRVPVFFGHAEAISIETRRKISVAEVNELLESAEGVELAQTQQADQHPTPLTHAAGKDPVFVGRIREDISHPQGICLWVVADNVRKGAALNAVQIMQTLEA